MRGIKKMIRVNGEYGGLEDFNAYRKKYGLLRTLNEDLSLTERRLEFGLDFFVESLLICWGLDYNQNEIEDPARHLRRSFW